MSGSTLGGNDVLTGGDNSGSGSVTNKYHAASNMASNLTSWEILGVLQTSGDDQRLTTSLP
jgi:hypothetical protein